MSPGVAWATVGALFVATVLLKSVGPVVTGGRTLSPRALRVIVLTPAALLGALVAVQAFTDEGGDYALGARTLAVAAAGVAVWRGIGVIGVIVIAAVVAAGARAIGLP